MNMFECTFVTQHLNEFNSIQNQFLLTKIEFDDEIIAFIVLPSLPNSLEVMTLALTQPTR